MMNSSFVKDAAARVAANVLNDPTLQSVSARIRSIYRLLYSRPPTESEETIATKFIADYSELLDAEAVPTAWSKLCHAMLAGGEFIYLR